MHENNESQKGKSEDERALEQGIVLGRQRHGWQSLQLEVVAHSLFEALVRTVLVRILLLAESKHELTDCMQTVMSSAPARQTRESISHDSNNAEAIPCPPYRIRGSTVVVDEQTLAVGKRIRPRITRLLLQLTVHIAEFSGEVEQKRMGHRTRASRLNQRSHGTANVPTVEIRSEEAADRIKCGGSEEIRGGDVLHEGCVAVIAMTASSHHHTLGMIHCRRRLSDHDAELLIPRHLSPRCARSRLAITIARTALTRQVEVARDKTHRETIDVSRFLIACHAHDDAAVLRKLHALRAHIQIISARGNDRGS